MKLLMVIFYQWIKMLCHALNPFLKRVVLSVFLDLKVQENQLYLIFCLDVALLPVSGAVQEVFMGLTSNSITHNLVVVMGYFWLTLKELWQLQQKKTMKKGIILIQNLFFFVWVFLTLLLSTRKVILIKQLLKSSVYVQKSFKY